jgi:hypothetical protein
VGKRIFGLRLGGSRVAWTASLAALVLTGCGVTEPSRRTGARTYPVQILSARFSTLQRVATQAWLVIRLRNVGHRPLPDVGVSLTGPRLGTAVQPFGSYLAMRGLAGHSRPVWVLDRPPGRCSFSCQAGGPGAASTPEPNTWAFGALRPGGTASFVWDLTPVRAGRFAVRYQVSAGLGGTGPVLAVGDGRASGTFRVRVRGAPGPSSVSPSGAIVQGR